MKQPLEELLPIFMLGCHRDIDLAVLSLYSLASRLKQPFQVTVLSDGSLAADDRARLMDVMPSLAILEKDDLDTIVTAALREFPLCRKYRAWCPWALKLLDIPLYAKSEFLYLDSDILFLRNFRFSFQNVNLVSMLSYANIYSFAFNDRLVPVRLLPIVDRLNSGFLFVRNAAFNLHLIERYLESAEKHKRPFLSEQTAWAVMAANTSSGHFNPQQVSFPQLALDRKLRLKWRPVAMHFVGGTRHLIPGVQHAVGQWPQDDSPIELKCQPSRRLSRTRFLIDLCRHRLLIRRCRRMGIVK